MKSIARAERRYHRKRMVKRNRSIFETCFCMCHDRNLLELNSNIPSWYKRMRRQARRAKEQDALRKDKTIPRFRKEDIRNWW